MPIGELVARIAKLNYGIRDSWSEAYGYMPPTTTARSVPSRRLPSPRPAALQVAQTHVRYDARGWNQ